LFYRWGVVEGLTVEKKGDRDIVIRPGIAIDREGQEIVLASEVTREIVSTDSGPYAFATITYRESFHEDDRHSSGGAEGYRRVSEFPEVHARRQPPAEEGVVLILARIHMDALGHIREIDSWGRRHAGPIIRPGEIGTEQLAEDSVTRDKLGAGCVTQEALADDLRASLGARGWLRMAFKPQRLPPVRPGGRGVRVLDDEPEEFVSDVAFTYCGTRGARGSMSIPVPPGATKVKAFRLAGNTKGTVMAQLIRSGWNARENRGEVTELLNELIEGPAFHHHVHIAEHHRPLDPHFHTLSLGVFADKEAEIWLAAVEFE
jgi:hypothetical protein